MHSRPKSIPIVAGFLFASSAIAAVVGISSLFPNPLMDRLWELNKSGAGFFRSLGEIAGLLLLALSAVTLSAARGLLRGRRWAWWFAVALFALDACGDVASYFVIGDAPRSLVGVAVSGCFLYLLVQRKVREWIGGPPQIARNARIGKD